MVIKKKPVAEKKKSGLSQKSCSVSAALEAVVKGKKLTRPEIVKQLWVYIKANKLQDPKNKRMICPDSKLSEVIGKKPVDMLKLGSLLSKHIT